MVNPLLESEVKITIQNNLFFQNLLNTNQFCVVVNLYRDDSWSVLRQPFAVDKFKMHCGYTPDTKLARLVQTIAVHSKVAIADIPSLVFVVSSAFCADLD